MKKPILIGITGGTGSGKTTVAEAIYNAFPNNTITMIMQDSYYKDQSVGERSNNSKLLLKKG